MAAPAQAGPTLPAELLLETFRYLALPDRVAARAVCRSWYAVADASPVIVHSDICLESEKLRCYLDQMRAAPLLYSGLVDMSDRWLDEEELDVAEVLADHMNHTVVLSLLIECAGDIPETWRPTFEAPAPLLRKLWLEFTDNNDVGDVSLFSHCAPRLTHCSLFAAGDIVEAMCPFKTIEVLVLEGPNWHKNLVLVFTSFPALRELSLEPRSTDDIDDEYIREYKPMDPPASLARLTIASETSEMLDVAPMFAWITHESIPVVCARHFCRSGEWAQTLGATVETVQRMLDVLALPAVDSLVVSCAPNECALRLVGSGGRERIHAGVPRETLAALLKTTPMPGTDLIVAGVHVLYTPDLVPSLNHFKTLRSFTLILRRPSPEHEPSSASLNISSIPFPAALDISSIPFSAALSIPPIYCPSLESVTLAITQADYDRTGSVRLSTKDVREFLRDKLREDLRRKLKTLCFRGISIDEPSALQPLAEEIHVRAYEPLVGFVYPEDDIRRFDRDGLLNG